MKLNRRYLRSIHENLSFYISSILLTVAALLMYFLFNIAGNAILDFSKVFFADHCIEDANFTTYMPIPDEDISELEKEYDLTLEKEQYINVETDGVTARVFKKTEKIDLYEVTVGEDIGSDDEIIISEGYAVNMNVAVGDRMKIGERSYTVTGFFQRPDYLYMLQNVEDSYKNITTFYLAYMTDSEFDSLGEAGCRYLVRYGKEDADGNVGDNTDFRKKVHENYYMQSYTSAPDNPRILMVDMQAELFVEMSYFILAILPLVAVALVSIIISRKVKNEQKMIGTLSALGYKKGQLMLHYAGFAAIPGIVGGVLTVVFAALAAQPYSELGLQDYEPMRITGHLNLVNAALGIIIPTVMYILAALLSVRRLLKKDTVLLLSGNADAGEKKRKRILTGSKMSFRVKYAVRSLVGNPMRGFVVFLGVFLGSFIILLGFAFFDSIRGMEDVMTDTMGSYEYQYILNELSSDNPYGGEKILVTSVETETGGNITLVGTDADNPYLDLHDKNGDKVDISDGYYITSLAAFIYDWHVGDCVAVRSPLSLEEKELEIAGILENDVSAAVYMSTENAVKFVDLKEGVYNSLISDVKLDIPKSKIVVESRKSSIGEQLQTMLDQMWFMIWLIIGLGVIICASSVYVAVNMMVTENRNNISMLKVLGYRDRKIGRIVLRVNHIFLPIGILLSIPAAYSACGVFYQMFADEFSMLVSTSIFPVSYVISVALTAASYFASLFLVKRKVAKVDMIESLKDNRE